MSTAMKIFKNDSFGEIRVIEKDGEPWFVAKDVCDILEVKNPSMSLSSLDSEERSKFNLGRQGFVNIINESGMYALILRTRGAMKQGTVQYKFRKWVTGEVLPSIRKTGSYSATGVEDITEKSLTDPDYIISLLQGIKKKNEEIANLTLTKDTLMHTDRTYTATDLAKELGYRSARTFNQALKRRGIQYKCSANGAWHLYAKYADQNYTETKQGIASNGVEYYSMKWTQAGRKFLLDMLGQKPSAMFDCDYCSAMIQ